MIWDEQLERVWKEMFATYFKAGTKGEHRTLDKISGLRPKNLTTQLQGFFCQLKKIDWSLIGLHHSADKNLDTIWFVLFVLRSGKSTFVVVSSGARSC